MGKEGLTLNEAGTLLNKHSGLQGISGVSSDMREIVAEMKNGDKKASYAFDVFTYRVKKYIGAYAAAMGGVDAVVFTGGIGENSPDVRNARPAKDSSSSASTSMTRRTPRRRRRRTSPKAGTRTAVLVIPTNEELVIALDTMEIVQRHEEGREPLSPVSRGGSNSQLTPQSASVELRLVSTGRRASGGFPAVMMHLLVVRRFDDPRLQLRRRCA